MSLPGREAPPAPRARRSGHVDIEDHQVERLAFHLVQRVEAIGGLGHLVAVPLQDRAHQRRIWGSSSAIRIRGFPEFSAATATRTAAGTAGAAGALAVAAVTTAAAAAGDSSSSSWLLLPGPAPPRPASHPLPDPVESALPQGAHAQRRDAATSWSGRAPASIKWATLVSTGMISITAARPGIRCRRTPCIPPPCGARRWSLGGRCLRRQVLDGDGHRAGEAELPDQSLGHHALEHRGDLESVEPEIRSRTTAEGASLVCRVDSTRCPDRPA